MATLQKPFRLLANHEPYKSKIPWSKILFFFGDERYVPESDVARNYHIANQYLFSKLPIPQEHIFPIPTHFTDPDEAANAYADTAYSNSAQLKYQSLIYFT